MNWSHLIKKTVIHLMVLITFLGTGYHLAADQYSPWGSWYKRGLYWFAAMDLAGINEKLSKENLVDTYETFPRGTTCGPETLKARRSNGTCNDLESPNMGAAGIRFGRNVKLEKVFGENDEQMMSPNPRLVSEKLLKRGEFIPVAGLNLLAAAWIQFMTHDWFNHVENTNDMPYEVKNPFHPSGLPLMFVLRSKPDSHGTATRPATYVNENTHWWDGSQIYGSNDHVTRMLRSGVDGKMKVTENNRIPLDPKTGIEMTGFNRNWWIGLSFLHNLFVLEHNRIADMLIKTHRSKEGGEIWTDDQIFNTARLINAAVMAKIHTVEWTPAILNHPVLKAGMNINWTGRPFSKNVAKFLNPYGLVGKKRELYNQPYSLTEEFVSVYRMHSLLPEDLTLESQRGGPTEIIPLVTTRNEKSHVYTDKYELSELAVSFSKMHPGALRLRNFPNFLRNLQVPFVGHIDMAAVDILRDRERGVPRYNKFREGIGLKPVRTFEDLTSDPETLKDLKAVYKNVDQIDLLVGCLAEPLPKGFGFGETAFQIFLLMAGRRIEADRFFTTDYTADVYTQEGLDWIDKSTMSEVLSGNIENLESSLKGVKNAFAPWSKSN